MLSLPDGITFSCPSAVSFHTQFWQRRRGALVAEAGATGAGGSLLRGGGRGTFQAQWPLPVGADESRVTAEYDHGILRVRLASST